MGRHSVAVGAAERYEDVRLVPRAPCLVPRVVEVGLIRRVYGTGATTVLCEMLASPTQAREGTE
jgi:hypothetical protein